MTSNICFSVSEKYIAAGTQPWTLGEHYLKLGSKFVLNHLTKHTIGKCFKCLNTSHGTQKCKCQQISSWKILDSNPTDSDFKATMRWLDTRKVSDIMVHIHSTECITINKSKLTLTKPQAVSFTAHTPDNRF